MGQENEKGTPNLEHTSCKMILASHTLFIFLLDNGYNGGDLVHKVIKQRLQTQDKKANYYPRFTKSEGRLATY